MQTDTLAAPAQATDTFPINGTDYIEFWVGNAKQASHFYRAAFGFQLVGYRGPETGVRDRASWLLQQEKVRFVVTTPIRPDLSDEARLIADHIRRHGDGVRDMALWVDDAREAFARAVERGAQPVHEPRFSRTRTARSSSRPSGPTATPSTRLVERRDYRGLFMPGFRPVKPRFQPPAVGLKYVDHCVGNVELGEMNVWVEFYSRRHGFPQSHHVRRQGHLHRVLLADVEGDGERQRPDQVPDQRAGRRGRRSRRSTSISSSIGVRACSTWRSPPTTSSRRSPRSATGASSFCRCPTTYYEAARAGRQDRRDVGALEELGILVDRDDEGYLLQIFTKPVEDRPTLFYEIIQRKGARSFGKGNFQALFEAIEREQAARGNL